MLSCEVCVVGCDGCWCAFFRRTWTLEVLRSAMIVRQLALARVICIQLVGVELC